MAPANVPAKIEVRSFTEITGVAKKGSGIVPSETALVSSYRPSIQIIPLSALVFPKFYIGVWVGVANLQSWGRGGRRGSGIVPFERALVSSYRRSIATFPLSLRVSEILPLLCPLFANPPPFSLKVSHVALGLGGWPLVTKSEGVGLNVRAICFQDFQPRWHAIARPHFAL